MRVAQDLHLHVARPRDVALVEQAAVAEGRLCLSRRGLDRVRELGRVVDDAQAAPTAAGAGLDE